MKVALFVAHPDLNQSRHTTQSHLNRVLMEEAKKNPQVMAVNLSESYNIVEHQKLMEEVDRIVLQFPIFWFNMPGLAKNWLDDVLTKGWAYGGQTKLLGKELMYALTSGQPVENYTSSGGVGKTIPTLFSGLEVLAQYCKMKLVPYFHVGGSPSISNEELLEKAKEYAQHIVKIF